jgi:hypothetical protein
MTFIVTIEGNELDLVAPDRGHITIFDIAWTLSQENRFGRCIRPYCVAEHSLLVCEIAERELGLDVHGLLASLLHDGHETYSKDMYGPAKAVIDAGDVGGIPARAWSRWEKRWERMVQQCFGIVTASHVNARAIHQADMTALATERRDLMPRSPTPWASLAGIEPVPWVDLASRERRGMTWEDWRDRFLDRYHELDFARNEKLFPATTPT